MKFGAAQLEFCRSLLFVPVPQTRFIEKAHERGAGAIILDLEDGVAPQAKAAARGAVRAVAAQLRARGVTVLVRINAGSHEDVQAAVSPDVAGLVLPKVDGPAGVHEVAGILARCEAEMGLPDEHTALLVLVETPTAVCQAAALAACHARVAALVLGSEDLALALSIAPTLDSLRYAAEHVVMAARAAGKVPLGVPGSLANIRAPERFAEAVAAARRIGMAGAVCIHPAQVGVVRRQFTPDPGDVAEAHGILAAFALAQQAGEGAVMHEGKMLDLPIVERARQLVAEDRRLRAAPAGA
ncbi:MAG: CoA ester lyase [Burkholderiales bacterium]|nr:CoA ester lyase [Burkholderiales bacterium]